MLTVSVAPTTTLAVTYKCGESHHDIRFWRLPTVIPSDVVCVICGGVSVVDYHEKQRHKRLLTGLDRWFI